MALVVTAGLSMTGGFFAGQHYAEDTVAPRRDAQPHGLEKVLAAVFSTPDDAADLGPAHDIEEWTIGKLDQFWKGQLPDDYQQIAFEPYDSSQERWPDHSCGFTKEELTLNAYFCEQGGSEGKPIVIADRAFFAELRDDSDTTEVSAITVLAHEWGHYASYLRTGGVDVSLREELQADCFAGMFVNWLAETKGVSSGAVERGAEVLFDTGDKNPTRWTAPGRHGTPDQRIQAFRDGQMAELHDNGLVDCEAYRNYRGETQDLGDGLELLLPPSSDVEYNEDKDKFEVVAPGPVYVEVARRNIPAGQAPEDALKQLQQVWFAGSKVDFVGEDSSSDWAYVLYDQRHPVQGPLHGTVLVLPVSDDATTLVVVDRYETGPAPGTETNQDEWTTLIRSAYAYARSVKPIG
jgi:predicted metalloprotease